MDKFLKMEPRGEMTTLVLLPSQNKGKDTKAKHGNLHTLRGEHKHNSPTPLGRECINEVKVVSDKT